jgi:phosphoribosylformimino-5-aminoimidazole carboxamide ribotide isomerase
MSPPLPIIPVLDLRGGIVVRGIAGKRAQYKPLESKLVAGCEPGDVAAALVKHFQLPALYVADLDAIEHDRPQWEAYQAIATSKTRLWLDAGIGTACALGRLELFLSRQKIEADVVVGLETLASPDDLDVLFARLGPERLIFSLDLKDGQLLTRIDEWAELLAFDLAQHIVGRGVRRMILLDLGAVGTGSGVPTLGLAKSIRSTFDASFELIGGGGVRSLEDLRDMKTAGFDAALVASALHTGAINTN